MYITSPGPDQHLVEGFVERWPSGGSALFMSHQNLCRVTESIKLGLNAVKCLVSSGPKHLKKAATHAGSKADVSSPVLSV